MKITIYGKSTCTLCTKAVNLAQHYKEDCAAIVVYKDMDKDGISKEDLAVICGKKVTTIPQVFVDNVYIGGWVEFCNANLSS